QARAGRTVARTGHGLDPIALSPARLRLPATRSDLVIRGRVAGGKGLVALLIHAVPFLGIDAGAVGPGGSYAVVAIFRFLGRIAVGDVVPGFLRTFLNVGHIILLRMRQPSRLFPRE